MSAGGYHEPIDILPGDQVAMSVLPGPSDPFVRMAIRSPAYHRRPGSGTNGALRFIRLYGDDFSHSRALSAFHSEDPSTMPYAMNLASGGWPPDTSQC